MISILMASHNANVDYFKKCIDSILNQTYQDFELVIVDDGSDVPVKSILQELQYNDDRIKLYRTEINLGLPKALNYGLSKCSGDYIARMDDDDIMNPKRIEMQLEFLENNIEFSGCFTWFDRITSDGKYVKTEEIHVPSKLFLKTLISKGNIFCHSTVFVKKKVIDMIGGYDENLRYAQDCDLYIRILENEKMGMINESLLEFRINNYRTNKYRDCLSLTYSYFSAVKHICLKSRVSIKEILWIFKRTFLYLVGCLRISRKKSER